jgi:hypothetical protein
MADTIGGWSSIVDAPSGTSNSSFRRRSASLQRQRVIGLSILGGLALVALIVLLFILL